MRSASLVNIDCKQYITDLYEATVLILQKPETDHLVMERAISCV